MSKAKDGAILYSSLAKNGANESTQQTTIVSNEAH
jgi:hypothetical protein